MVFTAPFISPLQGLWRSRSPPAWVPRLFSRFHHSSPFHKLLGCFSAMYPSYGISTPLFNFTFFIIVKYYGCYFILLYSSSLTASSHSLDVFSPGISKARWANQLSFAAPCQCFTLAGIWMTVPGRISCAGLPSS